MRQELSVESTTFDDGPQPPVSVGEPARTMRLELSSALLTVCAVVIAVGIVGLAVVVAHRQKRKRQLKAILRAKNLGPFWSSREIAQGIGRKFRLDQMPPPPPPGLLISAKTVTSSLPPSDSSSPSSGSSVVSEDEDSQAPVIMSSKVCYALKIASIIFIIQKTPLLRADFFDQNSGFIASLKLAQH